MPLFRPCVAAAFLLAVQSLPALAQAPTGLMADLLRDESQIERKMIALAQAMPAEKYDWRPGNGVRSVGEVYLHVAADNYFIPAAMGTPAPAATGIKAPDYKTADAYSVRKLDKDQVIKELQASYAFLKKAMTATTPQELSKNVQVFGGTQTRQMLWIGTLTDMHEHLGQSIAYARMNGVVPPWSK